MNFSSIYPFITISIIVGTFIMSFCLTYNLSLRGQLVRETDAIRKVVMELEKESIDVIEKSFKKTRNV